MRNNLRLINALKAIRKFYRMHISQDPFYIALEQWRKDQGDDTLRLNYPISNTSLVFDLGGYRGDWAWRIMELYNPSLYIFEPVPDYYNVLKERFSSCTKVDIFPFGLLGHMGHETIDVDGDASSLYKSGDQSRRIEIVDIKNFVEEREILKIDLIKINIEGGEFPLLERMIETGLLEICDHIQVQFHGFVPEAKARRERIQQVLKKSHYSTYNYEFVWESWTHRRFLPKLKSEI